MPIGADEPFLPSWHHPCGDIKQMTRKTWHITLSQSVLRERHPKHRMIDASLTLGCAAARRGRDDIEHSQMRGSGDRNVYDLVSPKMRHVSYLSQESELLERLGGNS
ncbi:hypothetical protein NPIL_28291 [Nephila pilipes]|uniref:Uncharacterized protein n=1 Tax=Nephila pilipes TaxID=299642 RepID=A0A8X6QYL0_NEPPI|nr:hypothetical protein NPIL_28291 [Nephila pilipes]